MTIWCDVEDLFIHAGGSERPTGIQRFSFELYAALQAIDPTKVQFIRIRGSSGLVRAVTWQEVEDLFHGLAHAKSAALPQPSAALSSGLIHSRLSHAPLARAVKERLPREIRQPLGEAIRAQISAIRHLSRTLRTIPSVLAASWRERDQGADIERGDMIDICEIARPGDVLASFGASWSYPDYASSIERIRRKADLRYAMLLYDLIPAIRPEYVPRAFVGTFNGFIRGCLPQADILLTISRATQHDTVVWAAREGITLRSTPCAIPIGTGFAHVVPAPNLPADLTPGSYALFVSTVAAHKNHMLAFRAWRRLLQELPADQVPTLVFAGRVGWMVADLMQQIENSAYLDGKLIIIESPDDATLSALYTGARFTLFPSLYEGWGLPVSESLAFGKVCLASNAASVPEAGGDFCLYHDPDSVTEALALYRRAITEPDLIKALEARISSEYRPVPWSSTARAVLDAIG